MSRYNEISQYFNSDNSASMDVERYTHITERTISTDLKIIGKYGEEEILSSFNLFFLNNSRTFLYLYAWNVYFKNKIKIIYYVLLLHLMRWDCFVAILNNQIKYLFLMNCYIIREFPYFFRLLPIKLMLPVASILFLLKD
ncbi:hypothetical protein SEEV1955_12142 [Salmonella enterica subsp. enterica serovar Virchow str. ATCC 51955]|nr:hypothetical protein SEEV1955_12142 [Salmonella enterica subsp. enterica serovar Virchow str. ATCC 51955]